MATATRLLLLFGFALVPAGAAAQAGPTDTFYAVSYVEAAADSSRAAVSALGDYRRASQGVDGYVAIEFFEQVGRPGHFAVVETWQTQKSFDGREAAIQKQLLGALAPVRVSDYDQRPYKTLTVGPASPASRQTVFVISHVDVTPNPQVPALLQKLAEASRKEPGNLRFDVLQHTMRANHFTVIEAWRNQQALNAHVQAAHTRSYRDEIQPFTGSPLDERVFMAVN